MAPVIGRICEDVTFGEGPHWDIARQCLYFVDMVSKSINRYVPETNSLHQASLDTYPSFVIPVEGEKNKFVVGLGKDISIVTWDGQSDKVEEVQKLWEVDDTPEDEYRLNDGKCDVSGRLWTGTTSLKWDKGLPNIGSIYSFGEGGKKNHSGEVSCSNGLTWSIDKKYFFFIDTLKNTIDRFDFDVTTGEIANRRIWFSVEKNNLKGFPDGMTHDEDGNLWIALFGGCAIIKVDSKIPETLLDTIKLPAGQVTSVAWGGENLDELYVTTGRMDLGDGVKVEAPVDGSLYRISGLGTKGLPMTNFKLQ